MSRRVWGVVAALVLATLVGVSAFVLRGATSEAPMAICYEAPVDFQCWRPDGGIGTGALPNSHGDYWEGQSLPQLYRDEVAARRATEVAFTPTLNLARRLLAYERQAGSVATLRAAERRYERAQRSAERRVR